MNNEKLEAGLASDLNRELDTGIAIKPIVGWVALKHKDNPKEIAKDV